jgi:Tol biopolymer transport system component
LMRIHLRSMDSIESRVLPGTENAVHPFWAPDGRSLAFVAASTLKRIDLSGSSARVLTQARVGAPWHGSWSPDGVILFAAQGLSRVNAEGGTVENVTKLDPKNGLAALNFPEFLPDGKRYLVHVQNTDARHSIELASLGSNQRSVILRDVASAPILAPTPTGKLYLLYLRDSFSVRPGV